MADYEESGEFTPETAPESQEQGESSEQTAPESQETQTESEVVETPKPEEQTPFHEHPRFQELVEQKNLFAQQVKAQEEQLRQMQFQFQQLNKQSAPAKAEDPMVARLREIDPEFGDWAKQQTEMREQMSEFQQWKQQAEVERVTEQANSQMRDLHAKNNVPENLQSKYQAEIWKIANDNPQMGLKDLPEVYKQVHESYSKIIEDVKRAERESYVTDKKADSKGPAPQPKGNPAAPNTGKWSEDPLERRSQAISRITKLSRAEGDI